MEIAIVFLVLSALCSKWAMGELEFYPDRSINPELQRLLEKQESRYPLLETYHDKHQQHWPNEYQYNLNSRLSRRISEIARKFQEMNDRYKMQEMPKDAEELLEMYKNLPDKDYLPIFKPNFRILDGVRVNHNSERFPEKNDDGRFSEDAIVDRNEERADSSLNPDGESDNSDTLEKVSAEEASVVDAPTEFAYPPSDARYFRDVPHKDQDQTVVTQNGYRGNEEDDEEKLHYEKNNEERSDSHLEEEKDVVAVKQSEDPTRVYIIAIVAGISAAATVGLIAFAIGWYNLQKHVKNASDVDYPAYGVTGPNKDVSPSGDRRLAQSAQMYHYQHQKQQIIAMERAATNERHGSVSEADSDEENEGDYTVYECPGLAPTGEMEVKNPMFEDDPTPAQTPAIQTKEEKK